MAPRLARSTLDVLGFFLYDWEYDTHSSFIWGSSQQYISSVVVCFYIS